MDIDTILLDTEERMEKALAALERDFQKLRTGRATTALVDGIKADYDSTPRQVPHTVDVASFKDNRQTFTEEQLKKETARCLGCGASVVDPNKCLGCGICTTRCKFDAIHLRKRTNVESIEYPLRKKVLPEFIAERQQKIQIRKLRQEK